VTAASFRFRWRLRR